MSLRILWSIFVRNLSGQLLMFLSRNTITGTKRSSGWLPWSSLGRLKLAFNISSDEQGSHPDDLSSSDEQGSHPDDLSSSDEQGSHPDDLSSSDEQGCHPDDLSSSDEQGCHPDDLSSSDEQYSHPDNLSISVMYKISSVFTLTH